MPKNPTATENNIPALKAAMGVDRANCETCSHLGSDSDGGEPEYANSWPVCHRFDRYKNLTSFPFKKEMPCWEAEFWRSRFTDMINGSDESLDEAFKAFAAAREEANHMPAYST